MIIPLRNQQERNFQAARLRYKAAPTPANFERFRDAYAAAEQEASRAAKP